MAFVTLGLAQLGVALAVRAPRRRGVPGNPWLGLAVAVSALLQLLAVAWAPLRTLLGTEPLPVSDLAVCLAAAAVPGLLLVIGSKVPRGRSPRP
jgi:Ca2+-transporting ATPase